MQIRAAHMKQFFRFLIGISICMGITYGLSLTLDALNCTGRDYDIWMFAATIISFCVLFVQQRIRVVNIWGGLVTFAIFFFMGFLVWGVDVLFGFVEFKSSEGCFIVAHEPMSAILSFVIFPCLSIGYIGNFIGCWIFQHR